MSKLIISSRYGTTPNEILNSKELSLKAKGLYGFLQCKSDNWSFSTQRIASQVKESEKVIRSTLQELERFGLLTRKLKPKDISGKWTGYEYTLHSTITDIPKPSLPKAVGWKNDSIDLGVDISNKDYSKQDISNKENNIYIADKSANDNLNESKPNKLTDLYKQFGLPEKVKIAPNKWQDEAANAIKYFQDIEGKESSVFKCFKDNEQKARLALSDCKELSKNSVLYFLKVYNELIKK